MPILEFILTGLVFGEILDSQPFSICNNKKDLLHSFNKAMHGAHLCVKQVKMKLQIVHLTRKRFAVRIIQFLARIDDFKLSFCFPKNKDDLRHT